ncbi:MAG TPA: hypothetical protein VLB50_05725 [Ignavibacteriaceae bacterium]|nr:hypothetical protein [Ignavibacteriaceae bacterium]
MENKTSSFRKSFFYINLLLFISYIILFEFILPENNILPRPDIILISIPALLKDYDILSHFLTTISAVYLPGILAYLILYICREFVLRQSGITNKIFNYFSGLFFIVPALLTAILMIYWFPYSFYNEYIFSLLFTFVWMAVEFHSSKRLKNESYILAFSSMGGEKAFLDKNILWNELKPRLFKKLYPHHLHLWALILTFEYIQDYYGLGTILRKTLYFHDFSALIITIFIIPVIILAGFGCLKLLENKFVFWEAE